MCGIFAILMQSGSTLEEDKMYHAFMKGQKRGPEYSCFEKQWKEQNLYLGFHRLAINGLDTRSHQPIIQNNCAVICNGEIYNHKELFKTQKVIPQTNSDCEVILPLYERNGIHCANMLDGVFSFILYDKDKRQILVARDPYGVRPLYECVYENNHIGFASDMESLCFEPIKSVRSFPPGSIAIYENRDEVWYKTHHEQYFHNISYLPLSVKEKPIEYYMFECMKRMKRSVQKRVENCEREVACLLSGGLDSSLISAFVCKMYKEKTGHILETYSIGLEGGEDLTYAKHVADHIGSNHTEVLFTNKEFIDSIPDVIKDIESYDTTSVRASVGNWNIGKYISQHSKAKVIFNGDGADELAGGYLYFNECPNNEEFHKETQRLLQEINRFDVLRSDKSISSHGLEPRTPFLDKEFTKFYLSIPIKYRNHNGIYDSQKCEKYFLRKSIELFEPTLLPKEILWRKKEAFSDGVSSTEKSWYEIIQEYLEENTFEHNETPEDYTINPPLTKEQLYYRTLFHKTFPKCCASLIPHFWMPQYVKHSGDASARTLSLYGRSTEHEIPEGL